jgi:rubrerythrin
MSYGFSADEIFVMAEQMEKNGARFYRNAAGEVTEPDKKKFLEDLAKMEDAHEKTFKSMRAELSEKDKGQTVFDPEGEAAFYLNALVNTRVFFEKEIDFSSMEGILKSAIEAEKDAIIFYLGMKNAVSENLGKNKLENIIQEEMGHVRLLSNKLVLLKK